ncbi:regenerating islet-derived protein 3-beta-like [Antedon mediterranea]|uniref:regenerating islet-derived protein 3-beta-like n=1 Tax=Antedon mediterranea TaxID=105859 RepID=UPI003AF97549
MVCIFTLTYNNYCYEYSLVAATWSEAKLDCESRSSTLVTINTEDELTHLMSSFSSSTCTWTGLNDITTEGEPDWLTHDTTVYSNYSNANNDANDCFSMTTDDTLLRNEDCNSELVYICEARGNSYKTYEIGTRDKIPTDEFVIKRMLAISPGLCSLGCTTSDACTSFSFNFMTHECKLSKSTGQDNQLTDEQFANLYIINSSGLTC